MSDQENAAATEPTDAELVEKLAKIRQQAGYSSAKSSGQSSTVQDTESDVECGTCVPVRKAAQPNVFRQRRMMYPLGVVDKLHCDECNSWLERAADLRARRDAAERVASLIRRSGLPHEYRNGSRGPRALDEGPQTDGYLVARVACAKLVTSGYERTWLWLHDAVGGTNKTTLAAVTLMEAMRSGHDGIFVNWRDFLEDLRASYGDEGESERRLMDRLRGAAFLVLDDVGAEKPKQAETSADAIYSILNARYSPDRNAEPGTRGMIVTSNWPMGNLIARYAAHFEDKKMGTRLERRLSEACAEIAVMS